MNVVTQASPEQVHQYTQGHCHFLAVALHRLFGWRILVVTDLDNHYWEDPHDSDNWIPCVHHVFAVDDKSRVWDIRGSRAFEDVDAYLASWTDVSTTDTDVLDSEEALALYVEHGDDEDGFEVERPLIAYTDSDIEEAIAVVRTVFPSNLAN